MVAVPALWQSVQSVPGAQAPPSSQMPSRLWPTHVSVHR